MLVIDPTRTDWSDATADFDARGMVARLKASQASDGVHRKLVIAYVDIGEAENWRWYWTWPDRWETAGPRPASLPTFILGHDPDGWGGNFPVAFWDPRWKDIVIYGRHLDLGRFTGRKPDFVSVLDEVIKDGFDGIYLDWVEGFSHSDVVEEARRLSLNPADEMVGFIQEMRAYAAGRVPGFVIIQQNGSALARRRPDVLLKVDAIGQEEVWYDGRATDRWDDPRGYDHPVDPAVTAELIRNLEVYQKACVPVLDIEYALKMAPDAYAKSLARGYVPYVTRRSLSSLTTTPPPGYTRIGTIR
jgi:cysteinyl-tRNA synthetase